MSNIHYFQRYSQQENVATNNTLLLLHRYNQYSPKYFGSALEQILPEISDLAGIKMSNQVGGSGSIPDGKIEQKGFKVVIETKLGNNFGVQQLNNHLNAMDDHVKNYLLLIGKQLPLPSIISAVSQTIRKTHPTKNITICPTTFSGLIAALRVPVKEWEDEVSEVIDDYEDYCDGESLLEGGLRMMAVPVGKSLADNEQYSLYYDPMRSHQHFTHIGFYTQKNICGIGEVDNVVDCDLSNGQLTIHSSSTPLGINDSQRILGSINAGTALGYNILTGHRFYLLSNYTSGLNFRKTSPQGILRPRYFDLSDFGVASNATTQDIWSALDGLTWI